MRVFKNKPVLLGITLSLVLVLMLCCMLAIFASWGTKETLQSKVQVSLLLQGDEADIYESPSIAIGNGKYSLSTIGTKDTNGDYEGIKVDGVEPTRKNYYDYVLPGVNIPKDPKIFITKKSGAPAYLYLEVFEHNFPTKYTENGFDAIEVGSTQDVTSTTPIHYDLEDYWVPVYQEDGKTQASGENGGKLYVYYNTDAYFNPYNYVSGDNKATYLSSYIMKDESNDFIDKEQYYGINEVKKDNNGNDRLCPYFNIIKDDTVYVSEKYIHSEYYSDLYSKLKEESGSVTKEGHDFGLYFYGYMASSKIDGEHASPLTAYKNAGFKKEDDFLKYLYQSEADNPENIPIDRTIYVWSDRIYTESQGEIKGLTLYDAVNNYFKDTEQYKIVLMENLEIDRDIIIPTAKFVFDMNGKTITAKANGTYKLGVWQQTKESATKFSEVIIRGNGTIYAEAGGNLDSYDLLYPKGRLTIENGNFIREYNPNKNESAAFNGHTIAPTNINDSTTIIYGGYFDNGYWHLSDKITGTNQQKDNTKKLLPVYDNISGKGYLTFSDGSYMYIDKNCVIWKLRRDEFGNISYNQKLSADGRPMYKYVNGDTFYKDEDNGQYYFENTDGTRSYLTTEDNINYTYTKSDGTVVTFSKDIYPIRNGFAYEEINDTQIYVRKQDENGEYLLSNYGNYEVEPLDSYTMVENGDGTYKLVAADPTVNMYGPDPRGFCVLGTGKGDYVKMGIIVYGGTFVGQNPAWGDEIGCQQIYPESSLEILDEFKHNPQAFFNPYYRIYNTNTQSVFLDGQVLWQTECIPKGYTISESSTAYTYKDANGETKTIYVPVYNVSYSK